MKKTDQLMLVNILHYPGLPPSTVADNIVQLWLSSFNDACGQVAATSRPDVIYLRDLIALTIQKERICATSKQTETRTEQHSWHQSKPKDPESAEKAFDPELSAS